MPRSDREIWSDAATATRLRADFHGASGRAYAGLVDGFRPGFGHIIGFSYQKQIAPAASGSWTLQVKRPQSMTRREFERTWRDPEGTWVKFTWMVDGQPIVACWGNIDSVNGNYDVNGQGARSATYSITGRDHGKVFEQTTMFVNMHEQAGREEGQSSAHAHIATMQVQNDYLIGNPKKIVTGLLETWLANYVQDIQPWFMPPDLAGNKPFSAILQRRFDPMTDSQDGQAFGNNLLSSDQSGASLWATMSEWSNPVMNELFCDVVDDPRSQGAGNMVPGLYLRRRPFETRKNKRRWQALRKRTLTRGDYSKMQVAKGGAAQRFNYWQLKLDQLAGGGDGVASEGIPGTTFGAPGSTLIISEDSIQRHGLRRYVANTKYIQTLTEQTARDIPIAMANWLEALHDWYVVSPMQLSGTIPCTRVMPEIRVGEGLIVETEDGPIEFYVEGKNDQWTMGAAGMTTLTVTRGEYVDDDLLVYAYECAGYDRPVLEDEDSCAALGALVGFEPGRLCRTVTVAEEGATDITGAFADDTIAEDGSIVEGASMDGLVTEGGDVDEVTWGADQYDDEGFANAEMTFELADEDDAVEDAGVEEDGTISPAELSQIQAEAGQRIADREAEREAREVAGRQLDPLSGLPTDAEHAEFIEQVWGR